MERTVIINTSSHGAITIQDDEGNAFKVNRQQLKVFLEPSYNFKEKIDVIRLIDFKKNSNSNSIKGYIILVELLSRLVFVLFFVSK